MRREGKEVGKKRGEGVRRQCRWEVDEEGSMVMEVAEGSGGGSPDMQGIFYF